MLEVVDAVIAVVGHAEMGLEAEPGRHEAAPKNQHLSATVELWDGFDIPENDSDETLPAPANDDGEEGWLDLRERRYASAIAEEIRKLIDSGAVLGSTGQPVRPKDILVLVRSRRALASLIVARLAMAGVAVAGVDRKRRCISRSSRSTISILPAC